jgi:hypothetical protein
MNKSELLNWLREEYRGWEALLDQIGTKRMEQPGVNGDWSMKDMVAHMSDFQPWLTGRIRAAARGEPDPLPPWPAQLQTDDEINAWIYDSNRGLPLREVMDKSHQIFQEYLALLESLPDDVRIEELHERERVFYLVWLGDQRFPAGEFFDHFHDDHEPDIRAWLARIGDHS